MDARLVHSRCQSKSVLNCFGDEYDLQEDVFVSTHQGFVNFTRCNVEQKCLFLVRCTYEEHLFGVNAAGDGGDESGG